MTREDQIANELDRIYRRFAIPPEVRALYEQLPTLALLLKQAKKYRGRSPYMQPVLRVIKGGKG